MKTIIGLISGLGLFLYGINLMKNGFLRFTSEKIKKILDLLTNNIFLSIFIGIIITVIMQSSSATTVMVVGLVNANILGLYQALGLIMGANIGTTITPQLLSFNFYGIEYITLLLGILLYIFPTKSKYKYLSDIFIGIGLLFTGMNLMEYSIEPLIYLPYFKEILQYFTSNPLLGLLLGFSITGLVQCSSVSIGMLMAICSNVFLPISSALPIIYGGNIGTCITSIVSSVGANKNAKRAALMHLIFNVIGTLVFIFFLSSSFESLLTKISPSSLSRQIANAHTLFNIINTIILLPFAHYIAKLTLKLIPNTKDDEFTTNNTIYLDERILQTPSIALYNTLKELLLIGQKVSSLLNNSFDVLLHNNLTKIDNLSNFEKDIINHQIRTQNYLYNLSKTTLNEENRCSTNLLFYAINNIELITSYTTNISSLINNISILDSNFIDFNKDDINDIYQKTLFVFNNSLIAIETNDAQLAHKIIQVKKEIQIQEKFLRKLYIVKLNNGDFNIEIGILYLDLLSNFEKISSLSANIAEHIVQFR